MRLERVMHFDDAFDEYFINSQQFFLTEGIWIL